MSYYKPYDGYTSFDYLEEGKEFKSYDLSYDLNRLPKHVVNLNTKEEKRFENLISKSPIISLRDHGFIAPKNKEDIISYCSQLHTAFHYEGLMQSGIDIMFENFMDGIALLESTNGLKWNEVISLLGIRYADIAKQDNIYIASTYNGAMKAKELNKIAVIPSLEAANILENELDRVDILYGLGIRCMGITYNEANTLGSGLVEKERGGLTQFGHRVIERMNTLGMLIDISHCNDQTSLDVIEASKDPVLITHAGAREVWNTPRMKSDEVLEACAKKGGVIGVCAAPNTTLSHHEEEHSLESIMNHFEYIMDLVGIEAVGFGPDTFYGDHVALQHAFDSRLKISDSHEGAERDVSSYVKGAENPTEAISNMIRWLVKKGYSSDHIEKAAGLNAAEVMKQVLK